MAAKNNFHPPRFQRGATAMMAAGFMLTGLAGVAAALDLGLLYYAKRDLQRMANLAALDAAQVAGGCLGVLDNITLAAQTEAEGSAQRNGGNQIDGLTVTAAVGSQGTNGTLRQFDAVDDPQNRAVRITLTRPNATRIFPFFSGSGGTLTVSAAAKSTPKARVSVGSKVVEIDPGEEGQINDLLGDLLGGSPTVDLATYRDLFGASIPVPAILRELPGSPDIPPTVPISAIGLLQALSDALDAQGDPLAADAAQALADAADPARQVTPSEIFGESEPAADALVNAGNLVNLIAQDSVAGTVNNLTPITLPPPLGDTLIRAGLPGSAGNEPSLLAGGVTTDPQNYVRNSQLVLEATTPINFTGISQAGTLTFFVQAGEATAEIDEIRCARRGQTANQADVIASSSISRIGIGKFDDINSPNPEPEPVTVLDTTGSITVAGLLGVPLTLPVNIRIRASAYVDLGDSESAQFTGMTAGETRRLGTASNTALANAIADIPSSLVVEQPIYTLPAGVTVPAALTDLVDDTLTSLGTTLETTLRNAISNQLLPGLNSELAPNLVRLGVTIGGADVTVDSISATQPELFLR